MGCPIGLIDFWQIYEKFNFLLNLVRLNRFKFPDNFLIPKLLSTKVGMRECSLVYEKPILKRWVDI